MNKLFIPLTLLACGALNASGAQLSPEEAISRLKGESATVRKVISDRSALVYTASTGIVNEFYVFNNSSGRGFTIVSADDRITPLLGYCDEGEFDLATAPENMRSWLESYQKQIDWAIANNVSFTAKATATRAAIDPLLTTRWDQESPYNDQCPVQSGETCATGCVATAMAQIMKFHEWPKKGVGSNSYRWSGQTLSCDFSSITFDWDNMLDSYSSTATAAQKEAVATLMYSCGVSVNMSYGPSSGAQSTAPADALVKYFSYDAATTYYLRNYFSGADWEQMIYDELAANRPVMYDGITAKKEGHEFVCDGYQNGYFHINWGWGGMSNGFFKLSALDPDSQGTGGGSSGFDFDQGATMGIRPPVEGSKPITYLIATKNFYTAQETYSLSDYITFKNQDMVYFPSATTATGRLGLQLTDAEGNVRYVYSTDTTPVSIKGMYTVVTQFSVAASSLPKSGTFTVKPAFYNTETERWTDILVAINYCQGFTLTVSGNTVTIKPLEFNPQISVTDVKVLSKLYNGVSFHATASATVKNNEFYGELRGALCPTGSNSITTFADSYMYDVAVDETIEIDYIGTFKKSVTAGDYDFVFIDSSNKIVSDRVPVHCYGSLANATAVELVSLEPESSKMPVNHIRIKGTVKCTSGYFADNIEIALIRNGGSSVLDLWVTPTMWLEEGESADFVLDKEYLDGKTSTLVRYYVAAYYNNDWLGNPSSNFQLTAATSAIENVTDGEGTVTIYPNPAESNVTFTGTSIESVDLYSITGALMKSINGNGESELGADVSSLAQGHYIAVVKDSGNVITLRLIKR